MFDQFKQMGQLAALLKDKQKLKDTGDRVRAELEALRVEGSAAGGAVRVIATGTLSIESVELAPAVGGVAGNDEGRAQVEGLITEATNDALANAREAAARILERAAQDLGLPPIPADVRRLLGS